MNVKNVTYSVDVHPWNESFSCLFFFFRAAKFDYFENQGKLHSLYAVATSDNYVISSSVTSWYQEYMNWARKNKDDEFFDQSTTPCK